LIAATLVATTSAGTISFECELFKFLFGAAFGDAAGERRSLNRVQTKHFPKIDPTLFEDVLKEAAGDLV
jgi:hypothetical protein